MTSSDQGCPVCLGSNVQLRMVESAVPGKDGPGFQNRTHSDDAFFVECRSCGEFVVTRCDYTNLKSHRQRSKWNAAHLSALLREQTTRPLARFWLQYGMDPYGPLKWDRSLAPIDLDELLGRWPRSVPERIDRSLCNLARLSPTGGHRIELD